MYCTQRTAYINDWIKLFCLRANWDGWMRWMKRRRKKKSLHTLPSVSEMHDILFMHQGLEFWLRLLTFLAQWMELVSRALLVVRCTDTKKKNKNKKNTNNNNSNNNNRNSRPPEVSTVWIIFELLFLFHLVGSVHVESLADGS